MAVAFSFIWFMEKNLFGSFEGTSISSYRFCCNVVSASFSISHTLMNFIWNVRFVGKLKNESFDTTSLVLNKETNGLVHHDV